MGMAHTKQWESKVKHVPDNAEACMGSPVIFGFMVWVDEDGDQVTSSRNWFHWDMNSDPWIQNPER